MAMNFNTDNASYNVSFRMQPQRKIEKNNQEKITTLKAISLLFRKKIQK